MNKRIKKKHNAESRMFINIRVYIKKKNRYITMKRNISMDHAVKMYNIDMNIMMNYMLDPRHKNLPPSLMFLCLADMYGTMVEKELNHNVLVIKEENKHEETNQEEVYLNTTEYMQYTRKRIEDKSSNNVIS